MLPLILQILATTFFSNGKWIDGVDYSGIAVGYGYETFFGPIELKYSFSPETRRDEWYVNVGYRF